MSPLTSKRSSSMWTLFQLMFASTKSRAALPIWIDFMEAALSGKAHHRTRVPENIIRLRVNRQTGLPTNEEDPDSYLEFFVAGTQPTTPHAQSAEDPVEGLF